MISYALWFFWIIKIALSNKMDKNIFIGALVTLPIAPLMIIYVIYVSTKEVYHSIKKSYEKDREEIRLDEEEEENVY